MPKSLTADELAARAKLDRAKAAHVEIVDKRKRMRAYSAFSRSAGPQEGAVLVVAHTARAAKRIAWPLWLCWNMDDYTDLAMRWLRDENLLALADQDKLAAGIEHAVDSPLGCQSCKLWGYGVDADGACCHCGEPAGELLVKTLRRYTPTPEKEKTMPKTLTADELANRARAELDLAEAAHMETVRYGRTSGRTTRLRAAKARAYRHLRQAMSRGLSEDEARRVYESAPPDPEFGKAEW